MRDGSKFEKKLRCYHYIVSLICNWIFAIFQHKQEHQPEKYNIFFRFRIFNFFQYSLLLFFFLAVRIYFESLSFTIIHFRVDFLKLHLLYAVVVKSRHSQNDGFAIPDPEY